MAAAQTTARRALLQLRLNNLVAPKELGYYNRKRQSVKTTGFVLTQAGANLLEDLLEVAGADPHHRWHRDIIRWQPFSATHLMRVNDALLMLEAATELADYDVVGWEDEAGIKSLKSSGAWTSTIQPDGYLMIDTGRSQHTILIEVDNDTEWLTGVASNTWTNKMHRYAEFFKNFDADPFWHGSARPVVLTFAPDAKRAQKLMKATTRAGNLRHHWFATFDPLYPEPPAPPKRDPALPKFSPNPVWLSPASLFSHHFLVHGVADGRTLADKFRL